MTISGTVRRPAIHKWHAWSISGSPACRSARQKPTPHSRAAATPMRLRQGNSTAISLPSGSRFVGGYG